MTATYTANLRFVKQGTGDNEDTWGEVFNAQFANMVDNAISGVVHLDLDGFSNNYTLTHNNGAADEARMAILVLTGTLADDVTIVTPSNVSKIYVIKNLTDQDGHSLAIKPGSGSAADVPPVTSGGGGSIAFTDGATFYIIAAGSGSGGGNDADTLNGFSSSQFAKLAANNTFTKSQSVAEGYLQNLAGDIDNDAADPRDHNSFILELVGASRLIAPVDARLLSGQTLNYVVLHTVNGSTFSVFPTTTGSGTRWTYAGPGDQPTFNTAAGTIDVISAQYSKATKRLYFTVASSSP